MTEERIEIDRITTEVSSQSALLDQAIAALQGKAAGGGGGDNQLDAFLDGSITEINSDAESVADYACQRHANIVSVNLPQATSIGSNSFDSCSKLKTFIAPNLVSLATYCFQSCSSLTEIVLPKAENVQNFAFQSCRALEKVDFSSITSIGTSSFYGCSALTTFIIRRTDAVCSMAAPSSLGSSGIAGGYIYVPAALVDSYKAAANWSTYAARFRALEDYTVDGTVTGELDETKV